MKRIVITEFMDEDAVARLRPAFDVLYDPALVDDFARLYQEAAAADAIIVRNRTQVRGELLAKLAHCKVVERLGVGLDNIDVPACQSRGIQVIPATGANALAVAEYVVGTAMVLLRGVYLASAQVASGSWPRSALSNGRETGGKILGLIGFGSVGRLTARLAAGLGMSVIATDPLIDSDQSVWRESGVECINLDGLLARADVVSLHVPLTDSTRALLSAERIARMKKGAIVINTARGGIADEHAIEASLRSGALGGAAFDVFEPEPLPARNSWAGCPNVILTPHVAGVTAESNARVSAVIAEKVMEALS